MNVLQEQKEIVSNYAEKSLAYMIFQSLTKGDSRKMSLYVEVI